MKKDFNFPKFVKENKDKWLYLEHFNETLNVWHKSVLFIKDYEKISGRLFRINGEFVDWIGNESFGDPVVYKDNFILSKIVLQSMTVKEITKEEADERRKELEQQSHYIP